MSEDSLWEDGVSIFRPSYSATWLFCEGSLIPSITAEDTAGYDAAVGTVFHELMAIWQTEGRPDYLLGEKRYIHKPFASPDDEPFEVEIDEEMFIMGEECLAKTADIPGDRYVETRVDVSHLTPIQNQGGTADLACCEPGILDITDWKYGKGVQVFAYRNTQLLLYASGFFREFDFLYDFQTIRLRIAQPRLDHFDLWEISRDELIEFEDWARDRAAAAWRPNAARTPAPKQCQWCKIRLNCAALEVAREALADMTFEVLDEPITHERQKAVTVLPASKHSLEPPVTLTTEQLSHIYQYRKLMEGWFKQIGEELVARGLNGEDLGGVWKIVEGRSRRKWRDEDETAEKFRSFGLTDDEIFERKLVSPNQSEKLLRQVGIRGRLTKAYLRLFVDRPVGRPTLAPDGDARSELPNPIEDIFEAEDDEASL